MKIIIISIFFFGLFGCENNETQTKIFIKESVHSSFQTVWNHFPSIKNCGEYPITPKDKYWKTGNDVGVKTIYCHMNYILPYETLRIISGHDVFLSGPHSKNKLDLENQSKFGHYNPKFVKWLSKNAAPLNRNSLFRKLTQPIYDKHFQTNARYFLGTYFQVTLNKIEADDVVLPTDHDQNQKLYNGYFYHTRVAAHFWARRKIDKTANLFYQGLILLLKTYDPKAIEKIKSTLNTSKKNP